MRKKIKVKGEIKVANKEMKQIRAGASCGQGGIACRNQVASKFQMELNQVVIVDKLKFT